MSFPYGIYIDKYNNIYIVESGNGVVREIEGSTGIINTIVGKGAVGFSGDGGPALNAELRPDGVWIDNLGTMYIADFTNNRIRKVYNPELSVHNTVSPQKTNAQIYPNPVSDELTIDGTPGNVLIVLNVLGQEVIRKNLLSAKESIDVRQLPQGCYVVSILSPEGTQQNFSLVKE